MKLIVGLGNPGPAYETTRHNAGFLVLDMIAEKFSIPWSGNKFDGVCAKGEVLEEPALLVKPMTFMNKSGRCVSQMMRFFKMAPEDLVVIHDDVDVPPGKVKARIGGSHGGHNGILSIIEESGFSEFHRIKLGVGKPEHLSGDVKDWVLGPMSDEELVGLQNQVFEDVILRLGNIFQQ